MPKILVDLDKLRDFVRASLNAVPVSEYGPHEGSCPNEEDFRALLAARRTIIDDARGDGVNLEGAGGMKLKVMGSNQTEVSYPSGVRALFSYNVPVAVYLPGRGFVVTSVKHSRTTTRHINAYIGGAETSTGTPEEIARLAAWGFYLKREGEA